MDPFSELAAVSRARGLTRGADVGERVFSRVRDTNMNEESYAYVAAPHGLLID